MNPLKLSEIDVSAEKTRLRRIIANSMTEKRWLVAGFVRVFYPYLLSNALDVKKNINEAQNSEVNRVADLEQNPFLYRMR